MIHVMAAIGLAGASMSPPVVCNHAIAVLEEEQHLRVPIIGRQRPAVRENDRLTCSPILVIDLRSVFRCDCAHKILSFLTVSLKLFAQLHCETSSPRRSPARRKSPYTRAAQPKKAARTPSAPWLSAPAPS